MLNKFYSDFKSSHCHHVGIIHGKELTMIQLLMQTYQLDHKDRNMGMMVQYSYDDLK
jgi:hypothetical protein